jgi:hypothetical protein
MLRNLASPRHQSSGPENLTVTAHNLLNLISPQQIPTAKHYKSVRLRKLFSLQRPPLALLASASFFPPLPSGMCNAVTTTLGRLIPMRAVEPGQSTRGSHGTALIPRLSIAMVRNGPGVRCHQKRNLPFCREQMPIIPPKNGKVCDCRRMTLISLVCLKVASISFCASFGVHAALRITGSIPVSPMNPAGLIYAISSQDPSTKGAVPSLA